MATSTSRPPRSSRWIPAGALLGIKVVGERLARGRGGGNRVASRPHDRCGRGPLDQHCGGPDRLTNLNDIAIAPNGDAYITDSERPLLYRIPAGELRNPRPRLKDLPVFLDWTGTPFPYTQAYIDANGIVVTPDGKYVLVVHYSRRQRCSGFDCSTRRSRRWIWAATASSGATAWSSPARATLCRSPLRLARRQDAPQRGYDRAKLVSETTTRPSRPHDRCDRRRSAARRQQPVRGTAVQHRRWTVTEHRGCPDTAG